MKNFLIAISRACADLFNILPTRRKYHYFNDDAEAIRSDWEKIIGKF